jgi:hypothetical protein
MFATARTIRQEFGNFQSECLTSRVFTATLCIKREEMSKLWRERPNDNMYPIKPIAEIVLHFFTLTAGLYILYRGWWLLKHPDQTWLPLFPDKAAIALRWFFGGMDAAQQLRAELTTPARMRRSGIYALLGGAMLSLGGALQVLA